VVKNAEELSWDSKISEQKVEAVLPRPWRKMIVCICDDVGAMMCDVEGAPIVDACIVVVGVRFFGAQCRLKVFAISFVHSKLRRTAKIIVGGFG
jgi:hypothetical protein